MVVAKERRVLFLGAVFIIATFFIAPKADAAIKTWDGGGADTNWTTLANWNLDALPLTTDSVVFDGTSTKNVTVDGTAKTVAGFAMNSGYTGIVTLNTDITNNAAAWTIASGTFTPGSSIITFKGTQTITGSFSAANVKFSDANTTKTIAASTIITVTGTLTLIGGTGGTRGTINSTGGSTSGIVLTGNLAFNGATDIGFRGKNSTAGTTVITVNGTGDQTITGGNSVASHVPAMTINKASGTLTFASGTIITVSDDFTYTAGTLVTTGATLGFSQQADNSQTITGSFTVPNVTFIASSSPTVTIAANSIITVTGTLTMQGGTSGTRGILNSTGGATSGIALTGNLVFNGATDIGFRGKNSTAGTTVITVNGTGDQTITGGNSTATFIPAMTINKASGTLTIANTVVVSDDFTYTAGTLSMTGSTVGFCAQADASTTITGSMSFNNLTFIRCGSSDVNTIAANTIITVTGTLTLNGTSGTRTTINSTGGATSGIALTGNLVFTSSTDIGFRGKNSTAGYTVITVNGTGDQTITGGNSTATLIPAMTINKASGTLTIADTVVVSDNFTYTAGTLSMTGSTVGFCAQADASATITGSMSFNNLTFIRCSSSDVIAVASGTALTVAGTLDMNAAASGLTVNGTGTISAQGNIIETTYGAAGSIQITANGTSNQLLTGTGTSASIGNFPPLIVDKSSGTLKLVGTFRTNYSITVTQGVFEHDTVETNALYFVTSGGVMSVGASGTWRNYPANTKTSTIYFSHTSAVTVTNNGAVDFESRTACGGTDIISISKVSGTASWTGTGTFKMYDVSLTNQGASVAITVNSGTNVSGNTGSWTFDAACPSVGISISGTVYTDEGTTAMTTTPVVRVKVNGAGSFSASANGSGVYTVSSVTQPISGDVITVYLDEATEDAVLVTRYSSGNLTSMHLYQNRVIVRHEDAGPTTNTNLDQYDNGNDADIAFTVTGGALTVSDGAKLLVWTGDTFTPGGTVTTSSSADGTDSTVDGDVEIQSSGILSMEANALSVGGDFTNAGTFSESGSPHVTTFTATATGHSIDNGTGNLDNVTFNGSGGGWSFADGSNTIDGDVAMTAGTLSGTNGVTVNGGDITGDGTINFTGGTLVLDGAGSFGGATAWTLYAATFGDSSGTTTTTSTGSGGVTVSFTLVISANQTLDVQGKTWTFSGTTGTPLSISGTLDDSANTSTFAFTGNNGSGNTTIPASTAYHHLTVNNSSETFVMGGTTTTSGNVTLTDATSWTLASGDTLTVGGTFTNSIPSATTWTGSTLYLNSGTAYTIGSRTQAAETYATLQVGANTDIRIWQSTVGTATVDSTGSLYSQDHGNTDGSLYIWADYNIPAGATDYWNYATDFDGTSLTGSERRANVRFASGAAATGASGTTLQIVGGSGGSQSTTVDWQSSGGYTIDVAGTINASYYTMDHIKGSNGFHLQSGATVTSVSNGTFDNMVATGSSEDAFMTIAASLIGSSSPTATVTGLTFANTGSGAECNIRANGRAQTGYWSFTSSAGAFDGEDYDCDISTAPGEIRWGGSAYAASGYFISSTFDTARTNGAAYNTLVWKGSKPTNTNVKIQLATSNCSNGATNAPTCNSGAWGATGSNYLGSDCTNSTFYTPAADTAVEIKCFSSHNNKRYFKYKVTLTTTDSAATPQVDDVVINYSQ